MTGIDFLSQLSASTNNGSKLMKQLDETTEVSFLQLLTSQNELANRAGEAPIHNDTKLSEELSTNVQQNVSEMGSNSSVNIENEHLDMERLLLNSVPFVNSSNSVNNDQILTGDSEVNLLAIQDEAGLLLQNLAHEEDIKSVATDMLKLLQTWTAMEKTSNTQAVYVMDNATDISDSIEELMTNLSGENESLPLDDLVAIEEDVQMLLTNYTLLDNAPLEMTTAVKKLMVNMEKLLEQLSDKKLFQQVNNLRALLNQWNSIESNNDLDLYSSKSGDNSSSIWNELLSKFQKRDQLAGNQQYKIDAKVTTDDVTKWIAQALTGQALMEKVEGVNPITLTTGPMSRLEQFVIHVNIHQQHASVDQQVVEQLQNIVKSSKFLTMANGTNQLSISLRPENLGDMMVRLTQINGEMIVKIVVSSHATKEMLESNIHQLKNMFAPHQVVIERQELVAGASQSLPDQEEQHLSEHEENNSQQDDRKDDQQADDDFNSHFQTFLMNEKV